MVSHERSRTKQYMDRCSGQLMGPLGLHLCEARRSQPLACAAVVLDVPICPSCKDL